MYATCAIVLFLFSPLAFFLFQIASVNAAYSEILTTSCGTTAIATDSTIYELSGVDGLDSRDTDVVTMDSAECSEVGFDASSNADCFM